MSSDQDTFVNGIEILSTDLATTSSASLYSYGGISIFATQTATDLNNGGALLVMGGSVLHKNVIIGGNLSILDTQDSINTSTGSIIINGGLGVNKTANINSIIGINALLTNLTVTNFGFSTISTGSVYTPISTISNLVTTNLTVTNFGFSTISTGSVYTPISTISNLVTTNLTVTNFGISTISTGSVYTPISTISNLVGTNISSGTFSGTSTTIENALFTNLTVTNFGFSTISTGSVYTPISTISNLVTTNLTVTNFGISTISTGSVYTPISTISNLVTTNLTVTNFGISTISTGSVYTPISTISNLVTTNLTVTNFGISTISTGSVYTPISTISNLVGTNISSGTFSGTSTTIENALFTNLTASNISSLIISGISSSISNSLFINISSGTISATSSTIPNSVFTNITTGTIISTNGTFGNFAVTSDLYVGGSLIAVNVTTLNLIDNNISTGSLNASVGITSSSLLVTGLISANNLVSTTSTISNLISTNISSGTLNVSNNSSLFSNSNTIGNLFTTGGNVGINKNNPNYKLDVSGNTRVFNTTINTSASLIVVAQDNSTSGGAQSTSGSSFLGYINNGLVGVSLNFDLSTFLPAHSFNLPTTRFNITDLGSANNSFNILTKVGASMASRLFIDGSGNIGINTTSPNFKLDVVGTAKITESLTTGNIYSNNITSTNIVGTNISTSTFRSINGTVGNFAVTNDLYVGGSLIAVNITTLNLIGTNISSGTFSGISSTIENSLFTNVTISNISALTIYGISSTFSNSVFINMSSGIISGTSSTIPNSVFTNITTGTISGTSSTIPNSVFINITTVNILSTNISSSTILGTSSTIPNSVFTNISSGTISGTSSTIPNSVFTNISSGTISGTSSTIPNSVFTNISSGTISGISSTIPNSVFTNISSGTISGTSSTIPNSVFTNISSGTISGTSSTIPNSVFTNISSETFSVITSTIGNSVFSNISSGTISATSSTIPNSVFTNISTGTISGTSSTIPNGVFTNISINNIISTNISTGGFNTNILAGTSSTISNSVFINISTGIISGNSSTISNILASNISTGNIIIYGTNNSTSTTTGSIITLGGVGINNNLYVGGIINTQSYIDIMHITTPSVPLNNYIRLYVDNNDYNLKSHLSSGIVKIYNPNNAKGDLVTHNGITDVRLPVGTLNQILYSDSTLASGVGWKDISTETSSSNPLSSKYLEVYNSAIQTVTGSFTDVIFESVRTTSNDAYTRLGSNIIKFVQSGTYIIMARVTLNIISGSTDTRSSMKFVLDNNNDTYVDVVGSTSSLHNRSVSFRTGSTSNFVILDITANQKLKVQVIRNIGTSTLTTVINGCNLIMIKCGVDFSDSSKYFNAYTNTNTTLTSTFADISLGVIRQTDSPFTFTTGTPQITITESGKYLISYGVGCDKTTGTDISSSENRLMLSDISGLNFTQVNGTLLYTYHVTNNYTISNTKFICLDLLQGQILKIQSRIYSGTNLRISSGPTFMGILKFQSTSSGQTTPKFLNIINSTSINITNSYTNLTFDTNDLIDSIYTHTISSEEVTVTEEGKYIVICTYSANMTTSVDSVSQLRLLIDSGTGYSEIAGSISGCYHSTTVVGVNSCISFVTINMSPDSKIKAQAIRSYGTQTIGTISNGINLSMIKIDATELAINSLIKFGTFYRYIESLGLTSTTSLTYVDKLTLTTDTLLEGYYRIGVFYTVSTNTNNGTLDVRIIENNDTIIFENTYVISSNNIDSSIPFYSHKEIFKTSGIHNFKIQFKSVTGTSNIRDTKIEFWRVK